MIVTQGFVEFDMPEHYFKGLKMVCSVAFLKPESYILNRNRFELTGIYHVYSYIYLPFILMYIQMYSRLTDGEFLTKKNGMNSLLHYGKIFIDINGFQFYPFEVERMKYETDYEYLEKKIKTEKPINYQVTMIDSVSLFTLDSICFENNHISNRFNSFLSSLKQNSANISFLFKSEIVVFEPDRGLCRIFKYDEEMKDVHSFSQYPNHRRYYEFFNEHRLISDEKRIIRYRNLESPLFEPLMWLLHETNASYAVDKFGDKTDICSQCVNRIKKVTMGCQLCVPKKIK